MADTDAETKNDRPVALVYAKINDFLKKFEICIDRATVTNFADLDKNTSIEDIVKFVYKEIEFINTNQCYPFNQDSKKGERNENYRWNGYSKEIKTLANTLGTHGYNENLDKGRKRIKEIFEIIMKNVTNKADIIDKTTEHLQNQGTVFNESKPRTRINLVARAIVETIIIQDTVNFESVYDKAKSEHDQVAEENQHRDYTEQVITLKNEMKKAQNVNVESLIDAFLNLLKESLTEDFFSDELTGDQITKKLQGLDDQWKAKLNEIKK